MGSPGDSSRPPLRLVLVLSDETVPNWLCRSLEAATRSGAAVVIIVLLANRTPARRTNGLLYRLHARLDRRLFRRSPDALAPVRLRVALPDCRLVGRADVRAGTRADVPVDVVLDPFALLPPDVDALRPRYGLWTTRFGQSGDAKTQSAPGYWEVVTGTPATETRLCVQQEPMDSPRGLYVSVAPTDRRSVARSQNHIYWKLAAALTAKLQLLWQDPAAFQRAVAAATPFDPLSPPVLAPRNRDVVRAGMGLIRRYVADKWRHARFREQWALAYQLGNGIPGRNGKLHTLLPSLDRFWADPFPVRVGAEYYVFHEELLFSTGKGYLVVTVLDERGAILERCIPVLEEDHHLSYPFVFQWEGDYFMIPETASRERIQLYRCVHFPDRWKPERVLLSGLRAFDATPALLLGKWWLFANVAPYGAGYMDELHVFHAPSPLGPWVPHRNNPIKADVRSARPAGRIFERDGHVYRPAQDCSKSYGYAVSLNQILRLDPDTFDEIEVDKILPSWDKQVTGVHTFNVAGDLTVIDCLVQRKKSDRP